MTDWSKISDIDMATATRIAKRAIELGVELDYVDICMAIEKCHISNPLDLYGLLEANASDLIHDVTGIYRHLNWGTDELEDCFIPKYSKKQ